MIDWRTGLRYHLDAASHQYGYTMPRPLLTAAQRAALFDHPTTERDLIRYYTLAEADIALVARQRHDHTRLGFALMLCTLRHPGRLLREGERPPVALIRFVAEQIGVFPQAFEEYLRHDQTRRRHAAELQLLLHCRVYSARREKVVAAWLLPTALMPGTVMALRPVNWSETRL